LVAFQIACEQLVRLDHVIGDSAALDLHEAVAYRTDTVVFAGSDRNRNVRHDPSCAGLPRASICLPKQFSCEGGRPSSPRCLCYASPGWPARGAVRRTLAEDRADVARKRAALSPRREDATSPARSPQKWAPAGRIVDYGAVTRPFRWKKSSCSPTTHKSPPECNVASPWLLIEKLRSLTTRIPERPCTSSCFAEARVACSRPVRDTSFPAILTSIPSILTIPPLISIVPLLRSVRAARPILR